jgi:hypothetical protein
MKKALLKLDQERTTRKCIRKHLHNSSLLTDSNSLILDNLYLRNLLNIHSKVLD